MEISKRWRIVPQLCLVFLLGAEPAFAGPTDLPSAPGTAQQARDLLQQIPGLNASAMEEFDRQKAACEEKVLISNCLREVEGRISRYRRDSKTLEINARELVRIDDQKAKDLARQSKPAPKPLDDETPLKADDPNIPSRREAKPSNASDTTLAPTPSVPAAQPATPRADKPTLSEQEQIQNRADYERKMEQARQRQLENQQRQQELDARRERYKQAQEEKARKLEKQAADKAARAAGGL